jgi:integral membrane protein
MSVRVLQKFEQSRPFSEPEAWLLFRIAAIAEAGGWTLLIAGMVLKRLVLHGNDIPVLIAGQLHGTIFLLYIIASIGLYPSLNWRRSRMLIAGLASVPPYGSLVFEQWAARRRQHRQLKTYHGFMTYTLIANGQALAKA